MANHAILTPQQRAQRETGFETSSELEKRDPAEFEAPAAVDIDPDLGRRVSRARQNIFKPGADWLTELGGDFPKLAERQRNGKVEKIPEVEARSAFPKEGSINFVTNQAERRSVALEADRYVRSFNEPQRESRPNVTDRAQIVEQLTSKAEQAPKLINFSLLAEKSIDNAKKATGWLFGKLEKGLFGLFNKKETLTGPKTEEEAKKQAEAKKKKGVIKQSLDLAQSALSQVRSFAQEKIMNLRDRLGLGGMGTEQIQEFSGENANAKKSELNESDLHRAATAYTEFQEKQNKAVEQVANQSVQGPKVSIDAAMEGGTGKGGVANISSQAAG